MNLKSTIAIAAGIIFLAVMFLFFPRGKRKLNDPLNMSQQGSIRQALPSKNLPDKKKRARTVKPVIMDEGQISEKELREFAALFEPIESGRKVAEIFTSGQSMLCDVFEGSDGSLGLTYLTVTSHAEEGKQSAILVQQKTIQLQKGGEIDQVAAPTILLGEYQAGEVSITSPDGKGYSLTVEGFHISPDTIQLMAEFKGSPIRE